jgi:hypothetical protein
MLFFSFSLYGSADIYTKGMIENAKILSGRFPDARIQIYAAQDVPADVIRILSEIPCVKLVRVPNKGVQNTFDRFEAIDDPDCSIMFVRDADSRPHARDIACIEDFLQSEKAIHIIRDHHWHSMHPIMAGMWGLRKSAMREPMAAIVKRWLNRGRIFNHPMNVKLNKKSDQVFLKDAIYPLFKGQALIHDRVGKLDPAAALTPFRVDIKDRMFCGQVYRFDTSGCEFTEFDP